MSTYQPTLIGAIHEMSHRFDISFDRIADALERIGGGSSGDQLPVFREAITNPREEVLLCYTVGTLEFTPFHHKGQEYRYGLLDMGLYTLEGKLNGSYQVIWMPNPELPPSTLYERPPEYTGSWDKVVKPIPTFPMRANSNAAYTFKGRGTLFATGPANLLLTPLNDGSQMFQVSVCSYVTGGTEEFQNASGVNTALGSSFVPKGMDVLNMPYGKKVPGVTVSTFRIVPSKFIGQPPENV
jgi:hypothetical protein